MGTKDVGAVMVEWDRVVMVVVGSERTEGELGGGGW